MAFEVIYDRYHRQLLAFCRHMLGSREDAEDVLQQTFASALRALPRNDQPAQLKSWLYTIARNRSLDLVRDRREEPSGELEQPSFEGLSEEVERRTELKQILSDLGQLPDRQRAALVLAEVSDLSHTEVAQVLDCEPKQVKSLVFQARAALAQDREARAIPCAEIREEIASSRDLRRSHLRRHIRSCPACADFDREVRHQRKLLAVALPVVPSLGLKKTVLAATGLGGGGVGGAAGGGGGLIAALGADGVGKVAAMAAVTAGAVGGVAATDPSLVEAARSGIERAARGLGQAASGELDQRSADKEAAEIGRQTEQAARAEGAKGHSETPSPNGTLADRHGRGGQAAERPNEARAPSRTNRLAGGSNPSSSQPASPGRVQTPSGANPSHGTSGRGGSRGAGAGARRSGRPEGRPLTPGRRLSRGRVSRPVPPVKRVGRPAAPAGQAPRPPRPAAPRGTLGRSPGASRAPRDPGGPRR